MKKTFVIISLALTGMFAACQKSNKSQQSKFLVASSQVNPTVAVSVSFGNPPAGGGVCTGKGICEAAPIGSEAGTTVTFQVAPYNQGVLQMGFHMSDLYNNQPEQVQNFTNLGAYTFAANYGLSSTLFGTLNLYGNAAIDTNTVDTIYVAGDSVTVNFYYAHS